MVMVWVGMRVVTEGVFIDMVMVTMLVVVVIMTTIQVRVVVAMDRWRQQIWCVCL